MESPEEEVEEEFLWLEKPRKRVSWGTHGDGPYPIIGIVPFCPRGQSLYTVNRKLAVQR
jgi:hypothetical protein